MLIRSPPGLEILAGCAPSGELQGLKTTGRCFVFPRRDVRYRETHACCMPVWRQDTRKPTNQQGRKGPTDPAQAVACVAGVLFDSERAGVEYSPPHENRAPHNLPAMDVAVERGMHL